MLSDRCALFCCCRSSFVGPPHQWQVDGVGIASAGDTFFSSSLASAALFVFRRDPSCASDIGPSGWARIDILHKADTVQNVYKGRPLGRRDIVSVNTTDTDNGFLYQPREVRRIYVNNKAILLSVAIVTITT